MAEATIAAVAETAVVTAFLERSDGRILVLKRAPDASTFPGRWAGVSGYLEADDALAHAYVELAEETGLGPDAVELLGAGRPLVVRGNGGRDWLVHPFLFRCLDPERVNLNDESVDAQWLEPAALGRLQTVPALEEAYVNAKLAERVRVISEDRVHGAGWLARHAVEALAEAVEHGADPVETGRMLAGARPSMGAVAGAVGRVLAAGRTPEQLVEQASALVAARDRAARAIAALLHSEIDGLIVMTHSASATVREAVIHAQPARVVCTASDPEGEGRPFADDLSADGLTVEVVADEDAEHALETVDVVLVGADSVFRDGSLVNKSGTKKLAEAARDAAKPFYVACETFKLAPFDPQEPDEQAFDLTPAELVTRYFTEDGAFASDEIAALVDRTPFLREGYELLCGDVPA